jgi:hypothetical protein
MESHHLFTKRLIGGALLQLLQLPIAFNLMMEAALTTNGINLLINQLSNDSK